MRQVRGITAGPPKGTRPNPNRAGPTWPGPEADPARTWPGPGPTWPCPPSRGGAHLGPEFG